jgi:hypothetical protein
LFRGAKMMKKKKRGGVEGHGRACLCLSPRIWWWRAPAKRMADGRV